MEIPGSMSIENRLAALAQDQQRAPGDLGREAFLDLLVSQLANQDPMSPLKDHEFVAQLATFSSLEQLEGINEGMQASILMNQSVNNSLATNLIGKEVLAIGDTISLAGTDEPAFQLELAADADVSIRIRDADGNLVRRIDKGLMKAGETMIEWDGKTDSGGRAPDGQYSVEVTATNDAGLPVQSAMRVRARVDGVRFVDGTGFLMVGESSIPLSSVMEVLAATS